MQIGMIGLGRMGANMVRRLLRGRHQCVVFDRNQDSVKDLAKDAATGAASLEDFAARLKPPRVLATGQREEREIPSGSTMTASKMVRDVKRAAKDWEYNLVSIGQPGCVIHS
jgi:6-phosphogluconate dehydrogenase (decarboxylating)